MTKKQEEPAAMTADAREQETALARVVEACMTRETFTAAVAELYTHGKVMFQIVQPMLDSGSALYPSGSAEIKLARDFYAKPEEPNNAR